MCEKISNLIAERNEKEVSLFIYLFLPMKLAKNKNQNVK